MNLDEKIITGSPIEDYAALISTEVPDYVVSNGDKFADEIAENIITDFIKEGDLMVHVSSFAIINDVIYMTFYANPAGDKEEPDHQTARLAYCSVNDVNNKVYIDLQTAGDKYKDKTVDAVYDTILLNKDNDVLYLMWTASLDGEYHRLYCTYTISTNSFSDIEINKLIVKDCVEDFSFNGIKKAFTETQIGYKRMFVDIGIMQKLTSREENGEIYYYTGAYSGDFNFIIKSRDLVNWYFAMMPDFINDSKWENAVYVKGDYCYYFMRQQDESKYGVLTRYNFETEKWDKPVLVGDSQSRADFIEYDGKLFLFHAPIDREHIGILYVDENDISKSKEIVQAKMHESCFYPFVQYSNGELYISYTSNRKVIRLSKFQAGKYLKP